MELVVPPAVWVIGNYFLYSPETRGKPATRFWLRLTFTMTLLAVIALILRLLISDAGNDRAVRILRMVQAAAFAPVVFWFIVATVRGWSK